MLPTEEISPQIGMIVSTLVSPSDNCGERVHDNSTQISQRIIEFMDTYNSQFTTEKLPTEVPCHSIARVDVFWRKVKDAPKTRYRNAATTKAIKQ